MRLFSAEWLPSFDVLTGTLSLPLWSSGVITAVILVLCILALQRNVPTAGSVRASQYCVAVVAASFILTIFASLLAGRTAERRELEQRSVQLTGRANSALACLDGGAGDLVQRACEKVIFAGPETVASAISYVAARVQLLIDGFDYAERLDRTYAFRLEFARRALEADPFGMVSHVLTTRFGCTHDRCAVFPFWREKAALLANFEDKPFEAFVQRYVSTWEESSQRWVDTAPADGAATRQSSAQEQPRNPASRVSSKWDFPSSKSIPPVSIMDPEPGEWSRKQSPPQSSKKP